MEWQRARMLFLLVSLPRLRSYISLHYYVLAIWGRKRFSHACLNSNNLGYPLMLEAC